MNISQLIEYGAQWRIDRYVNLTARALSEAELADICERAKKLPYVTYRVFQTRSEQWPFGSIIVMVPYGENDDNEWHVVMFSTFDDPGNRSIFSPVAATLLQYEIGAREALDYCSAAAWEGLEV